MKTVLDLVQSVSFIGIILGGFTLSKRSGLRHLFGISLVVCVISSITSIYWDKIVVALQTLLTWGAGGVIAILIVIGAIKVVRKFIFGKHM